MKTQIQRKEDRLHPKKQHDPLSSIEVPFHKFEVPQHHMVVNAIVKVGVASLSGLPMVLPVIGRQKLVW
jgi:hypothetical protein